MRSLKIGKAAGFDGLNNILLKAAADSIAVPLTHILNMSINKGYVMKHFKKGKVTPIFKDGARQLQENYRPITVLPVLSIILEKAVHTQLYEYLTKHELISDVQSGFRPKHSTMHTLLKVTDYIYSAMDRGEVTGAIFLEFKKAFDTVSWDILLNKLRCIGMDVNTIRWFESL